MMQYVDWAEDIAGKIREKMEWVSEKNKEGIPYRTDHSGNYDDKSDATKSWAVDDGLNWWTNGFWGGIQWMLYQDTGKEQYARIARLSEEKLEQCIEEYYGLHHDVGFMFMPTAVTDWRLTGNPISRRTAIHAASLLAARFNPVGKFIRAWNDGGTDDRRGWAIVDSMMNLSLLYWASEETKDPRFRQIAMMHADTVRKYFVRQDGSASHIVEFDPESGRMLRSLGGQGYGEGSSWTRGQGWALYGFMISYRHTGKQEYLNTARKVAGYCLDHIPADGIIPIDFKQPAQPAYEDSCGACIIAGGLLELAECVPEPERENYEEAAVKILRAIIDKRSDFSTDCDAIVQNCSAAYHAEEHHITMVYADYFFIEAIYKITGSGNGKLRW